MKNLKKTAVLGLAVCSALVLFAGCQNSYESRYDVSGRKTYSGHRADQGESTLESTELKYSGDLSNVSMVCEKHEDCTMVPFSGCFGCYVKGGAHLALNIDSAKKVMESRRSQCEAMFQDENKRPKLDNPETAGSCSLDGAKCIEGMCKLVKLTDAEKKARDESIKKAMEQMQQQGGGKQPMKPQPPRQGYPAKNPAYGG